MRPRAIRVGPNEGGEDIWAPNSGRSLIRDFIPKSGSLSSLYSLGSVYIHFNTRTDKPLDFLPACAGTCPDGAGRCGPQSSRPLRAQPNSQLEFVLRDAEESEYLNLVDFGGDAISLKLSHLQPEIDGNKALDRV